MAEQPDEESPDIETIRKMLNDYYNRRGISRALLFPEEEDNDQAI